MQFYQDLGFLIFGSRLRRLSEYYLAEVNRVYQEKGIAFEASWFPVFFLLSQQPELSLVDISQQLQTSHSAVSQLISSLRKKGWVELLKSPQDGRKQLVRLSVAGKQLLGQVKPVWSELAGSLQQLAGEDPRIAPLLEGLSALEERLKHKSLSERILKKSPQPSP